VLWVGARLVGAAIALFGIQASGASYSVSYDPYARVDWSTTLRCQSQHHDHVTMASRVQAMDAAGYCAIMFLNYSGLYRASSAAEWLAVGSPNPDPGVCVGWCRTRRWPPTAHGAPALPLTNLRFYIPGAEEIALLSNGRTSNHMTSVFLTEYIEGVGCEACGQAGVGVARNPFGISPSRLWGTDQEGIDRIVAGGGHATLNHWVAGPSSYPPLLSLNGYGSFEMYNNYYRMWDDKRGNDVYSDRLIDTWDLVLQEKGTRIWGVAVNDWFSAWTPLGPPGDPVNFPEVTLRNRDRGKLQVLLESYDLASYRAAFEAGAFFAIVDDHEVKNAYPQVTSIAVRGRRISITTAAGSESIVWIGDGALVGEGPSLALDALPEGLAYVRAEISDREGRTVYTQPFTLGPPSPPASSEVPAPSLPAPRPPEIIFGIP